MTYLLDTNVCIRYLNGRSPAVRERLHALHPRDIVVCSVVKTELFFGAARSHDPVRTSAVQQRFLAPYRSLSFDDHAAEVAARVRAHLAQQSAPIGPYDLQIAAIALVNDCVLVTNNVREFSRVPGLQFEDWERASR